MYNSNDLPSNEDLEKLLDEESDSAFDSKLIDSSEKAVLKEWSAKDFSDIYVRFRPHLERHARRYLRNPSQIDEVVQDAFLYLMVTLPELDSELGVLRFLKWKTRLLCIDVIRANSKAEISSIDSHPDFESNDPEISQHLERADDAAVVRLALSKLNPRHREVLLASMYEEKTSAQIAEQVGLTENATNQLIYRARSAFKRALLGDGVDTTGMSAAAILSVAARKAAAETKKIGAQAMVFVLFAVLSIGALLNFNSNVPKDTVSAKTEQSPASTVEKPQIAIPSETSEPQEPNPGQVEMTPKVDLIDSAQTSVLESPLEIAEVISQNELINIVQSAGASQVVLNQTSSTSGLKVEKNRIVVADDAGLLADFIFNVNASSPFENLHVTVLGEKFDRELHADASKYRVVTDESGFDRYIIRAYFDPASEGKNFDGESVYLSELYVVEIEVAIDPNFPNSANPSIRLVNLGNQ